MRKLIAAINITIDGFCDHTAGIADAELHQHYTDLLKNMSAVIYGRITYQLMESHWPSLVKNPGSDQSSNEFAVAIDNIQKILFSRTLKEVTWRNTRLVKRDLQEEALDLKQQTGADVLVGSPSMILALTKLNLIDEYQLCIHPVIVGSGLPLFKSITDRRVFKLLKTKTFSSGANIHYYEPLKNE